MRVLVYGAGVIGRIYAGRLTAAGHDVTLYARGSAAATLQARGVVLVEGGVTSRTHPDVTAEFPAGTEFDVCLVAVRRDQIDAALPELAASAAASVVFLLNQSLDLERRRELAGSARTLFAFPGVGGRRREDGAIEYLQTRQQKTTVEARQGAQTVVVDLLRSAGFAVEVSADMAGWLKTHTVFVTTVGAALLAAGGIEELTADRSRVAAMVAAVDEGFRALARAGVTVTPAPLRTIFTAVPRFVSVRYWQRALRGPLGTLAIAPHIQATRDTELPAMAADARQLVAGHGPAPHLDRLLKTIPPT